MMLLCGWLVVIHMFFVTEYDPNGSSIENGFGIDEAVTISFLKVLLTYCKNVIDDKSCELFYDNLSVLANLTR